jgi:O-acetyl-ADP-ribose deacetylase (regulator of RNase III)
MPIVPTTGDILERRFQNNRIVPVAIPVNCEGVPGAGLALDWARRFPYDAYRYQRLCGKVSKPPLALWEKASRITLGRVTICKPGDEIWLLFPTKGHWRERSDINQIRAGLVHLRKLIGEKGWPAVSLPALGCGLGGLPFDVVKAAIEEILGDLDTTIYLYAPKG